MLRQAPGITWQLQICPRLKMMTRRSCWSQEQTTNSTCHTISTPLTICIFMDLTFRWKQVLFCSSTNNNADILYTHCFIFAVARGLKLYTPQINFISNVMPASPLLTQPEELNRIKTCNSSSASVNCTQEYCECTHLLKVRLNSIVELVLVDR